ncbi:MAG: hypothetical protein VX913_12680, partial [Planctomycetota bacterium]|nr:hypothetical protein [Planctomycetota bacterium]
FLLNVIWAADSLFLRPAVRRLVAEYVRPLRHREASMDGRKRMRPIALMITPFSARSPALWSAWVLEGRRACCPSR